MKKVLLLIACSLFGLQIAKAQLAVDSLNKHYAIGAKAHAQGNYLLFVQSLERCLQILPGNASLLYNRAMGYALLNDYTNTTAYLNQLCAEGKVIPIERYPTAYLPIYGANPNGLSCTPSWNSWLPIRVVAPLWLQLVNPI